MKNHYSYEGGLLTALQAFLSYGWFTTYSSDCMDWTTESRAGKMGFRPINSDHAIESATFIVRLGAPIGDDDIVALHNAPDIRVALPSVNIQQINFIDASLPVGMPQLRLMLDASIFRADGTAVWNLKVNVSEIRITCTRYTRWAKVWRQARELTSIVLGQVPQAEIKRFAVSVTDKFLPDVLDYDLSLLFKKSELLPAFVFDCGPLWHNHSGWFDGQSEPRVLNHLNIDARQEGMLFPVEGEAMQYSISITHSQQGEVRAVTDPSLRLDALDDAMEEAHLQNKKVISSLLSDEIADSIGLKGSQKS